MAGFFSGLGAAIGGAGQAAVPYGQQVRSQLEARRNDFAGLLGKTAETETDPQTRTALLKHQSDLLSGKPIGQIAQDFQKTIQNRVKDEQALHGVIGQAPQPPQPVPGAAPGVTPGQPIHPDTFNLPGAPTAPPLSAAQPDTNPIAGPQGGIQAIQPPSPVPSAMAQNLLRGGGTAEAPLVATAQPAETPPLPAPPAPPASSDPRAQRTAIIADYGTKYQSATPAMRPLILAQMNDSLAQLQPFEQVAQRKAQFEEFSNTPYFKSLPPQMQAAYAAQASGFAPVNTPQGALVPNKYQSRAEEQDPALLSRFGIAPDYKGPITISKDRLTNQIMDIVPGNPGLQLITNNDGTTSFVPKTPGATGGVAPAVATRVTNGGVDATGHTIFFNPLNPMGTHVTAPGVNASVLPTVTGHTSVTNPDGSVVSSTQRSKVLTPLVKPAVTAPGVKAAPSETPVPTGPGAPAVPTTTPLPPRASVPPFDPANRLDSLVQQIANGDTTLEKAKTNARDKFQIEDRMAQLGLTPANITTSMRERATNARNILKEMDRIDGIITQADKDGDLGVVATRWNDFLTNKLGSDPTKTQVFSKLSSDLGFLSTAVSMAHGGLRGGSSPTMVEHWEKALDAKDPATLKSKLGEARQWMEQYAQMDKGLKGQPITPLQAGGSVVSDLIKKYK